MRKGKRGTREVNDLGEMRDGVTSRIGNGRIQNRVKWEGEAARGGGGERERVKRGNVREYGGTL